MAEAGASSGAGSPAASGIPATRGFERTAAWIFDLDNTLYPADAKLFVQIDHKMNEFIARLLGVPYEHAQHLRKTYYRQFGTTLTGLMRVHKVDPKPYLDYVHDIDLSEVEENPALRAAIERLPGRRLIFTNGSRKHAERVAAKIGVLDLFEDICDIEACDYTPKPEPAAFDRMIEAHGVHAREAAMFEDMPHNLEAPHALGMTTVLIKMANPQHPRQLELVGLARMPEHIHHVTEDLPGFLDAIELK